MTTQKCEYYAIETAISMDRDIIKECFDSKEEAEEHIFDYGDWDCNKGWATIVHYIMDPKYGITRKESWFYHNGKCTNHYDF